MLHSTPRCGHEAARNHIRPSRLLTMLICIFVLGAVSCKKHSPEILLCDCDVAMQGGDKLEGGQAFKGLAFCGEFNLPFRGITNWATTIEATLGEVPYGTYSYAELLDNSNQGFFSTPFLESHTDNFKYFISASIKDLNGNPVVEIKNNKWFVYLKNVSKYNYDSTGFEVFNKTGEIALSFDFTQDNGFFVNLEVQGVVPTSDSTMQYYNHGFIPRSLIPIGTPALNKAFHDIIYAQFPIKPLFRYTGPGWQHARLPI